MNNNKDQVAAPAPRVSFFARCNSCGQKPCQCEDMPIEAAPPAPTPPSIDCPLCGVTVEQVASASLSLALWQHVNWACRGVPTSQYSRPDAAPAPTPPNTVDKPWWCETCTSWRFSQPCGRDECPVPSVAAPAPTEAPTEAPTMIYKCIKCPFQGSVTGATEHSWICPRCSAEYKFSPTGAPADALAEAERSNAAWAVQYRLLAEELRALEAAHADLVALVLALQAHAKEAGWQDEDQPITDLLEWHPAHPAAPALPPERHDHAHGAPLGEDCDGWCEAQAKVALPPVEADRNKERHADPESLVLPALPEGVSRGAAASTGREGVQMQSADSRAQADDGSLRLAPVMPRSEVGDILQTAPTWWDRVTSVDADGVPRTRDGRAEDVLAIYRDPLWASALPAGGDMTRPKWLTVDVAIAMAIWFIAACGTAYFGWAEYFK